MPDRARARKQCYEELLAVAKGGLAAYYNEHNDRLGDARSTDAIKWSTEGVQKMFEVLNKYEIRFGTNKPESPKTE